VAERDSYTDMTFSCIVYDIYETAKQLNYVPAAEAVGDAAALQSQAERIMRVMKAQERLEERYLRHLDMTNPFHWGSKMVADCIRASLWLVVYRPLQQRPGFGLEVQHPNVLHLSVEIMERAKMMNVHPAADSFRWLSTSYVQYVIENLLESLSCAVVRSVIILRRCFSVHLASLYSCESKVHGQETF
jgi:hypothetical protein